MFVGGTGEAVSVGDGGGEVSVGDDGGEVSVGDDGGEVSVGDDGGEVTVGLGDVGDGGAEVDVGPREVAVGPWVAAVVGEGTVVRDGVITVSRAIVSVGPPVGKMTPTGRLSVGSLPESVGGGPAPGVRLAWSVCTTAA